MSQITLTLPGLLLSTITPSDILLRSTCAPNEMNCALKGSLFSTAVATLHPSSSKRPSNIFRAESAVTAGSNW
eukprot:14735350-Alexandrium_andersonii.AAC.1